MRSRGSTCARNAGISDEEQHGIWYELAQDMKCWAKTIRRPSFETIYAENVDFRDVAIRCEAGDNP